LGKISVGVLIIANLANFDEGGKICLEVAKSKDPSLIFPIFREISSEFLNISRNQIFKKIQFFSIFFWQKSSEIPRNVQDLFSWRYLQVQLAIFQEKHEI
jgi:hypothetical protein